MALNRIEIQKVKTAVENKLQMRSFRYGALEIVQNENKLKFVFENIVHPLFKNVEILSHGSFVKDTSLYTHVFVKLRLKYDGCGSPKIGYTLTYFKIILNSTQTFNQSSTL